MGEHRAGGPVDFCTILCNEQLFWALQSFCGSDLSVCICVNKALYKELNQRMRNIGPNELQRLCLPNDLAHLSCTAQFDFRGITFDDKLTRSFCYAFDKLPHGGAFIESLDFTGCKLGDNGAIQLGLYISRNELSNLRVLRLSTNRIGSIGAKRLFPALSTLPRIQVLEMSNNPIGDQGFTLLPVQFRSELASLSMAYMGIRDSGVIAVAQILRDAALTHLDLSGNRFGESGSVALVESLSTSSTGLTSLQLSDTGIRGAGAHLLGSLLQHCPKLQLINLGGNPHLDVDGATSLANALKHLSQLTRLSVFECNIRAVGFKNIMESVACNRGLTLVNISRNYVGPSGFATLTPSAAAFEHVQVLNLSHNCMQSEGCHSLAAMFKCMTTCSLRELDISSNNIHDEGVAALSPIMSTLVSLRMLNVACNGITKQGIRFLADGLLTNNTISQLNLSGNPLDSDGAHAVANILLPSTLSVRDLRLRNTGLDNASAALIAHSLARLCLPVHHLDMGGANRITSSARAYIQTQLHEALDVPQHSVVF